jgi:hypothetical protein
MAELRTVVLEATYDAPLIPHEVGQPPAAPPVFELGEILGALELVDVKVAASGGGYIGVLVGGVLKSVIGLQTAKALPGGCGMGMEVKAGELLKVIGAGNDAGGTITVTVGFR